MTVLTPYAVGVAGRKAGWPLDLIPWVIMTSFGESGWNTEAVADGAKWGDSPYKYYGLMQISDIHKDRFPNAFPPSDGWKEPVMNMYMARTIYEAQGPTAFSGRPERSGSTGASQRSAAELAGAQVKAANIQVSQGIPLPGGVGVAPGGQDFTVVDGSNAVQTIVGGKLLDALGLSGWGPALWIGGGSILVVLGVLLLAKSEVLGSVGKVLNA